MDKNRKLTRRIDEMDKDYEKLKMEINNLIWMYSPDELKIKSAEKRALSIMEIIIKEPTNDEQ